MTEALTIATIIALFVLSLLCFKASRLMENWTQDVRPPLFSKFYGSLLARLGLRYFARHSAIITCLIWVAFSVEFFVAGLNAILVN